jgi:alanine racemase
MARATPNPDNRLTIDLGALEHNLEALRGLLPAGCRVAGVVKADAYGHGLLPVARRLKARGAEALAVGILAEGQALRRGGLTGPIWLLLGLRAPQARRAAELDLTPICGDLETFQALDAAGQAQGRAVTCQLKVDTGMSRLGVPHGQALEFLTALRRLKGIRLTGLASHLATAGDPGSRQAAEQAQRFAQVLAAARQAGWDMPDSSLSGSGGTLAPPPQSPGPPAFARLGISLYGCLPDPASAGLAGLRPVMGFATRLLAVRRVEAGSVVSYGATWRAPADTWLGVLPVGYSDGYPRALSNRGQALVGGEPAPVRGRVCMNLTMVDLGGLPALPAVGDEVVLLGRQGRREITADQLGDWAGTISYEITCGLGAANRRRQVAS